MEVFNMDIPTGYWTPIIVKVENGFIIKYRSPKEDIYETYVCKTFDEMVDHIRQNFKGDN